MTSLRCFSKHLIAQHTLARKMVTVCNHRYCSILCFMLKLVVTIYDNFGVVVVMLFFPAIFFMNESKII